MKRTLPCTHGLDRHHDCEAIMRAQELVISRRPVSTDEGDTSPTSVVRLIDSPRPRVVPSRGRRRRSPEKGASTMKFAGLLLPLLLAGGMTAPATLPAHAAP